MQVSTQLELDKKISSQKLKENILNSITLNYDSNEICLNSIADEFGITPAYLSNIFKQYTGENFANYISRLRVDKAKTLLLETDMTLQAIAEDIGYANSGVFIKVFKRFEFITPGAFREQHKTKKQVS